MFPFFWDALGNSIRVGGPEEEKVRYFSPQLSFTGAGSHSSNLIQPLIFEGGNTVILITDEVSFIHSSCLPPKSLPKPEMVYMGELPLLGGLNFKH